jgi:hypothetical protein
MGYLPSDYAAPSGSGDEAFQHTDFSYLGRSSHNGTGCPDYDQIDIGSGFDSAKGVPYVDIKLT